MANGILYVLTNDAMPGVVKIGKTKTSIQQRLKELDSTGVPLPFRCYYAVEVEDCDVKERKVHDIFADHRVRPNREFFNIAPERVVSALSMLGTEVKMSNDMIDHDGNVVQTQQQSSSDSKRFDFGAYQIPVGATLVFTRDSKETCQVSKDASNVLYSDGKTYSLSELARKLMEKRGYNWKQYRGPSFFKYNDEVLSDIKARLDSDD